MCTFWIPWLAETLKTGYTMKLNKQQQLKELIALQKQDMNNSNSILQHRDNKTNRVKKRKVGLCTTKERGEK